MSTNKAAKRVQGKLGCYLGPTHNHHLIEYRSAPLDFEVPARGIDEKEVACPFCGKPVVFAVKSSMEAAAILLVQFAGMFLAGIAGWAWLFYGPDLGDKFFNGITTLFACAFLVCGVVSPAFLFIAREPQFEHHVFLIKGLGDVIGHAEVNGERVAKYQHALFM